MGKPHNHGAEEVIRKLRQADVLLSQGKTVGEICRELGVSDATYYKWRKVYGGMGLDQARQLRATAGPSQKFSLVGRVLVARG